MSWDEIECPKCGVRLKTRVRGMVDLNGNKRKDGFCPICNELIVSEMTNGLVDVELNPSGGLTITNPLTGRALETTPSDVSIKGATFSNKDAIDKFTKMYWPNAVIHVDIPVKG